MTILFKYIYVTFTNKQGSGFYRFILLLLEITVWVDV